MWVEAFVDHPGMAFRELNRVFAYRAITKLVNVILCIAMQTLVLHPRAMIFCRSNKQRLINH